MADEVKDTRPPPPEWLNNALVQKALRSGDGDQTITVVSSEARMANAVGDGYASDMYRVTAQLGDGTVRSVIVKCHPQGGKREDMVKKWDGFTIEQNMLTKTVPAMSKLLEKANPGKYPPLAAKCLYHGDQPVKFLVLEDLRQIDFTLAERHQGLNLAHCSLVMQTLARFHASSIALHEKDPDIVECYKESVYGETLREHIDTLMNSALLSLANEVETWPDYKEKYADKLHKSVDTFYDRLVEVCKRKEGGYNVLIHSDPWASNMMFKYDGDKVVDVRLVDFQTAHYSSPAIDLHYFLTTSSSEEVRTHHIGQLLQEYLSVLNQTLEELGYSKYQITLDDLKKELNERIFFAFYAAVNVLPIVLSKPQDGFDFEQALTTERENLKSTKTIYSSEAYKIAMKRLLPIFENKGLF